MLPDPGTPIPPVLPVQYTIYMLRVLTCLLIVLMPLPGCAADTGDQVICDYSLTVSIDVVRSSLSGTARITVPSGGGISLVTGGLDIKKATLDGQPFRAGKSVTATADRKRARLLEISFEAAFPENPHGMTDQAPIPANVISDRGVSLKGLWYPRPEGLCVFRLTAALPAGFEAVSEAEKVEKSTRDGRSIFAFHFPYPIDGITLIASDRYRAVREQAGSTEVVAYFFPEDLPLVRTYLDFTKRYLALYERLIGPYPYRRFAVVEHFLPTGYSMPTFTLLGQDVVRLPFIVETSLGHEVLHQWFGNLLYVDYAKGNWSEGLTTYLADHLYEAEAGRGAAYRKGLLVDYESYTRDLHGFPLRQFTGRVDLASRATGYGKGAMLFHMLRRHVGDDTFFASLRDLIQAKRHQRVSWIDLERAFAGRTGQDLSWFFTQWLDRADLPDVRLGTVRVEPDEGGWKLSLTLAQQGSYRLDLPVAIYTPEGRSQVTVNLRDAEQTFSIASAEFPGKVVVDEQYDVARRLAPEEVPPVIGRLLAEERPLVVLPAGDRAAYVAVVRRFGGKGAVVKEAGAVRYSDTKGGMMIILSADNPLAAQLYGRTAPEGGFSLSMKKNPFYPDARIALISSTSTAETDAALGKTVHYGRYSQIAFNNGKNVRKQVEPSENGIARSLAKKTPAVDLSTLRSTEEVIDKAAGKKVVYVGETHDRFSHHLAQLEIIRGLHKRGKKIAIGMEMFQRPFQKALDDYISGKIDEKQFLRESQYFRRWGYDYALYRPILQFARSAGIPVVALNVEEEIVKKVSSGGLDSLSADDKKRVPAQMDFADAAYAERLKKIHEEHRELKDQPFEHFLQVQVLWDETMAESVDRFLKARPDYQIVVLAGSGHLSYGSGIPKRVARRNGLPCTIILNDAEMEKDIADYVLFPQATPGGSSPKLLVTLKEEGGRVFVTGFSHGSGAEKAGLQTGDQIVSVDGVAVRSFEDVRIELVFRNKGDRVSVKALRAGGAAAKEMAFEVELK